jgi:hypothetical protein
LSSITKIQITYVDRKELGFTFTFSAAVKLLKCFAFIANALRWASTFCQPEWYVNTYICMHVHCRKGQKFKYAQNIQVQKYSENQLNHFFRFPSVVNYEQNRGSNHVLLLLIFWYDFFTVSCFITMNLSTSDALFSRIWLILGRYYYLPSFSEKHSSLQNL